MNREGRGGMKNQASDTHRRYRSVLAGLEMGRYDDVVRKMILCAREERTLMCVMEWEDNIHLGVLR